MLDFRRYLYYFIIKNIDSYAFTPQRTAKENATLFTRRDFLKTAVAAGGAVTAGPIRAISSRYQTSSEFFGVHPFIENNPDAVFIMRTNVEDILDSEAKKEAGLEFSRSVIVPREDGVPLTSLIPIKPNIRYEFDWNVNVRAAKRAESRIQGYKGTDAFFVEGVIEGMKELGLSGDQFFIREVNSRKTGGGSSDYPGVAERTGAELRCMADKVGVISENDLVWVDTPHGIWYRKIPYLWPVNAPETWLLNIAKFKAHSMCLTLCAKNLQGAIAHNYQQHCAAYTQKMDMDYANHKNPTALEDIKANYERHLAAGVPRWDRPGDNTWNSGIGMETWASRCIDNNAATSVGLHILEGIYGIDGHFYKGPNPPGNENNPKGESWEYMTNIIVFGMNAFHIDIIGHWLGGHEPGNVGLFHMAMENGLSRYLNPMSIPVYEWKNGTAVRTPLTDFERTPLKTYYMRRDYAGDEPEEDYWHLCNEPFDYTAVEVEEPERSERPAAFLHQNRPNPFNPYTSIEYTIPYGGHVRLEIYNSGGQLVDVLVDRYRVKGSHMAVWNTNNHSSGVYFYRFRFDGHSETKKMTLLK